jgi:L-lactate dehydrogenase
MSSNKIIGSGTILDTARLKNLIKEKTKVSTKDIVIDVIGEHGDNSVILWSRGYVNMIPITRIFTERDMGIIDEKLKNRAYDIINKKGYTSEGISLSLLEITKAILNNENKILNISTYYKGVYISMPSLVNKDGVKGIVNADYNIKENIEIERSISVIKDAIDNMEV